MSDLGHLLSMDDLDAQTVIAKRIARELHRGMPVNSASASRLLWQTMCRR